MPKEQLVHPRDVRKKDTLTIAPIAVNHYRSDPGAEKKRYGVQRLQRVYHDMVVIREFETMLNTIKMTGEWEGISYNHAGPAHLSIGQESAAVGQAMHLDAQDFIFGSHRSHGEILAKCFSAIAQSDEATLQGVMETYLEGDILRVLEKQGTTGSVTDLAEDFILYGTLAEIFARNTGLNRGLGGSMHAFFAPFGSMPNNAIVGGSADIALGSALYKRINKKPGIVIANIGDASAACGPVWEAIMISAMDQYRTLWPGEIGGAPPVIFNFFNNFYGMGGQTVGETMGFKVLARLGAGVNEENMHAERVDGSNPLAVADAILRKKTILAEGRGPVLLDTITYRISGHSPSDASSYRSKEEVDLWKDHDPIQEFRSYLLKNGMADESSLQEIDLQVREKLIKATRLATDLTESPRMNPEDIARYMFSNSRAEALDQGDPQVLLPLNENPRLKQLEKKERFGIGPDGTAFSRMKTYQLRDALFEAMIHRFYKDPTMVAYGEENRDWGGAFAVYRGLTEALPYQRLFNSSIAEGAIVGSGVGYALSGGRAVVELMYNDFMGRAGDEIFNQMAKWQAMSAGVLKMPLVVRVSVGSKYGAQHSQDWSSITSHIPGLKVYFPATPYDAKGMLNEALAGTDPVIFFESQRLYDIGELFHTDGVPREYYEIPPGEPDIKRAGTDLTIVTIGATLYRALDAADDLQERYGISAEVIDARFINPLNLEPIVESVRKTGRLVLASDAVERGSFLYSLGGTVAQLAFDHLDAPPVVVGSRNWITPASELEDSFFPQKEWIIDSIHEKILPLPGHQVSTVQTNGELLRRYREGV
ncbi:2-oxoisovalerate dehydrogenase E1 component [Alkalispirochaeta americana]|uniref:2-oxoisovalerate dehydrogenase E1 component n=1 Tax=Alkalispirochaeta americana TaxID=159291 RepID=A0A1N6QX95_9SPIO|nr:alpha-ketoacid dehydrogenase subunit alpha/beta [Alkalispirochaeta americana]SIQ21250.1 2-oxoisovalerate dehydrogenase E1 component [Alkalispirochaeta americana]